MSVSSFADRLRQRGWVLQNHGREGELGRCFVYRVSNHRGERFAIKRIRPQYISSVMFNELVVMNLIQNPRPEAAVRYHEVWRDPEGTVIRMDEHNGTLRRWIKPHHILSDPDWFPIMLGITSRLAAAHAAGLVHMDLKPSNILVNRTTEFHFVPENIHISDYGIPYCCRLPIGDRSIDVPGTMPYLAPEVRENGIGSTKESDMWAVGCIGYELCIGKKLADHNQALEDYIRDVRRNPDAIKVLLADIPPRFGQPVHDIIRECLRWDPEDRCTADQIRAYLSIKYQRPGGGGPGSSQ